LLFALSFLGLASVLEAWAATRTARRWRPRVPSQLTGVGRYAHRRELARDSARFSSSWQRWACQVSVCL